MSGPSILKNVLPEMITALLRMLGIKRFEPRPGIWVEPNGPASFVYHDHERTVMVNGELMSGAVNCVIYTSSIDFWTTSSAKIPVTPQEREYIIEDICKYLEHSKWTYEIIRSWFDQVMRCSVGAN